MGVEKKEETTRGASGLDDHKPPDAVYSLRRRSGAQMGQTESD